MEWKIIVLVLLTLGHLYRLVLNFVQRRSANNPTPANVADVYDAETYKRWKDYSADKCRLTMISTVISYVAMVLLLVFNVHAAVASLFGGGIYGQLIVVILFDILVSTLINVWLNYFDTMVIEQKYGFNRSTVKTFVTDQIRGLIIEIILAVGLACLLALIHMAMGDWMILLFAAAVFCITLIIAFLYPIFSRLGNKFVPLEEGELKDRLMELLTKHGYQVKAIEVMDASRRTTKLNAYFTGFGKLKTIVLYDNLVNAMTPDEICGVFAHELGHGLHKDVLKGQIMNLGNLLLMAVVVWFAVRTPELHTSFGFEGVNYGFGYILLGIGLSIVQPLTGMIMNARSRYAEYRADRQAVKEGYGKALITGLKLLAKENFSHLAPAKSLVVLEYSHPPLSERIAAIENSIEEEGK